jgi:DNA-binding ferritin-like protein (Dps family)
MIQKWTEKLVTGPIDQKRQWRQYKARTEQLPASYRKAIGALEHYMLNFGPSGDAKSLISMLEDLADLFEQSAASGTPVRAVVGDDPVEFAETFLQNYPGGSWIASQRERLTKAIDQAAGDES